MKEQVVVAMSGGVDSSVAAYLLKEQGYEVVGMSLKTWPKEMCDTVPKGQTCCSTRDVEDARAVADRLGIPFYVVEASAEFKTNVVDYFIETYRKGETPNPCVVCNRKIKSGLLLEKAEALGIRRFATGHYASVLWDERRQRYTVREAVDRQKDQSYVLFQLTQEQLSSLILPMGDLPKPRVRELARQAGLQVADKPESMELCFIPDGDTQGFLRARVPEAFTPGEIVDRSGRLLGTHQGIGAYTVGQRKGLGIAHAVPLYVLELDPVRNRIVVGEEKELAASGFRVSEVRWMAIPELSEPMNAQVKIRSHSDKISARLVPEGPSSVRVEFGQPLQRAVSPGQAAVFYDGDIVLGGGWIQRRRSSAR